VIEKKKETLYISRIIHSKSSFFVDIAVSSFLSTQTTQPCQGRRWEEQGSRKGKTAWMMMMGIFLTLNQPPTGTTR
jgi:hypothetical protein